MYEYKCTFLTAFKNIPSVNEIVAKHYEETETRHISFLQRGGETDSEFEWTMQLYKYIKDYSPVGHCSAEANFHWHYFAHTKAPRVENLQQQATKQN